LYLKPKIREKNGIVSFYDYETVEGIIKYKYHKFGSRVFKLLSYTVLKPFAEYIKENLYILPVDDKIKKGYSHTAIMAASMKTSYLTPLYSVLHSKSDIKYAGKSLEFRLKNPRNFKYTGLRDINVILVDDIATTGLTLKQAEETLQKYGVNVVMRVVFSNLRK
jgi:competence protein ComFC